MVPLHEQTCSADRPTSSLSDDTSGTQDFFVTRKKEATVYNVETNLQQIDGYSSRVEVLFSEADLREFDKHDEGDDDSLKVKPTDYDNGSVISAASTMAYFEPIDFRASNWIKAMDVPTFGLAVVALTTAITHPIFFVAGALTLFGTATVVGVSHEFFTEGPVGKLFCFKNDTPLDEIASVHEFETQVEDDDQKCSQKNQTRTDFSKHAEPSALPVGERSSARLASESTFLSMQKLPDNWIEGHYPPLENEIVNRRGFFGLNVIQFFRVFFADKAPYNFLEFQKKRGDLDIVYGPWKDTEASGPLSLMVENKAFPSELEYLSYQGRALTFRAKTNSFLGPPYATTTKTQRILIISKKLAVLESKTTLADIPFCDRFYVMERWIIAAAKNDGRYTCIISAHGQVFFTKSCPFEHQIRTNSKSTVKDVATAWGDMAQEALKLTEKAKRERLRRNQRERDSEEEDFVQPRKKANKEATPTAIDKAASVREDEIEMVWTPPAGDYGALSPNSVGRLRRTLSQFAFGQKPLVSNKQRSCAEI